MSIHKKLSRSEVFIVLEQLNKFDWSGQDEAFRLDAAKQFKQLRWLALKETAESAQVKKLLDQRKQVASSTFSWPGQQDELARLDSELRRVNSPLRRRNPQIR